MHEVDTERLAEVFDVVGPLYRRAFRTVERAGAELGLSVGVRAVLDLLHRHGPMTVPQMGREQDLTRQFVQRMVNDAAAAGLVIARPNPAHRRSVLIDLTPAGTALIEEVLRREHAQLRQIGADLTRTDIDTCLRVLRRLLALLQRVEE
jgi:DNA-binding MarR family transcriptional regulator